MYVTAVTISECVPLHFILDVLGMSVELACCVIGPVHFYLFLPKLQMQYVPQVEKAWWLISGKTKDEAHDLWPHMQCTV